MGGRQAVGRALRRGARRCLFRREHVLDRAGCLEDRAGASGVAARAGGFTLLDTQFVTDHLRQFGTVEVDRDDFQRLLEAALRVKGNFLQMPKAATPAEILAVLDARSQTA